MVADLVALWVSYLVYTMDDYLVSMWDLSVVSKTDVTMAVDLDNCSAALKVVMLAV